MKADVFQILLMILAFAVLVGAAVLLNHRLPEETDEEWVDRQW